MKERKQSEFNLVTFEFISLYLQLGQVWEQLKPMMADILPKEVKNGSATTSPRTSPIGSPAVDQPSVTL